MEENFDLEEFLSAFKLLDRRGVGELDESDVNAFLESQGFLPSQLLA